MISGITMRCCLLTTLSVIFSCLSVVDSAVVVVGSECVLDVSGEKVPSAIGNPAVVIGKLGVEFGEPGRQFCSFLGIPYAEPPVGALRFEPPIMAKHFASEGRKYYTVEASPCLQWARPLSENGYVGSEDCLFLNIHTTTSIFVQHQQQQQDGSSSVLLPSPPTSSKPIKDGQESAATDPLLVDINNFDLPHSGTAKANDSGVGSMVNDTVMKTKTATAFISSSSSSALSTAQSPTPRLKPVVVWVHGGSYNVGSGSSDTNGTDYIVAKDIVVVTINYRMGALGFMSLPAANVTGNYGLLDQQMALKWIRRHISQFGGDPLQITLMGWSAGAASIGLHMLAESSRGLFQRAIMMSGSAINPWAFNVGVGHCSAAMLEKWNLQHVTVDGLKVALKNLDAADFVPNDLMEIAPFRIFGFPEFCFVPTIDGSLTTESPEQLLGKVKADNSVSLMIGATVAEIESDLFSWINAIVPNNDSTILLNIDEYLSKQFQSESAVFDERRMSFVYNLRAIVDMHFGVWNFARQYGLRTGQPVFLYHFSYAGQFGRSGSRGACHGDDLGYLFGDMSRRHLELNAETDQTIRSTMVEMWTSFIKNGHPTSAGSTVPLRWSEFNSKNESLANIMHINTTLSLLSISDLEGAPAYQLWKVIYRCLFDLQCDDLNNRFLQNKTSSVLM